MGRVTEDVPSIYLVLVENILFALCISRLDRHLKIEMVKRAKRFVLDRGCSRQRMCEIKRV